MYREIDWPAPPQMGPWSTFTGEDKPAPKCSQLNHHNSTSDSLMQAQHAARCSVTGKYYLLNVAHPHKTHKHEGQSVTKHATQSSVSLPRI